MINYKQWRDNIYDAIKDISNLEQQKRSWTGNDPVFVSSYIEDVSMLLDSYSFANDFWKEKHQKNLNFKNSLIQEMKQLKEMLHLYDPVDLHDDQVILNDPEWKKITIQAQKVIVLWDRFNVPY